jgi:pimeloyl-ACP methyl ester carboxylesterase
MIVVSGGGEDSIEQMAYQLGRRVVCEGLPAEQGRLVEQYFPPTAKGPAYADYAAAMEVLVEVEGWETFAGPELRSEADWQPWPTDTDAYFDPMTVIENTTIPVLAVFGEMDRWIDPVQGAEAYGQALQTAGNSDFHVELIPGVGHTMQTQSSICGTGGSTSDRYLELLEEWAIKLRR